MIYEKLKEIYAQVNNFRLRQISNRDFLIVAAVVVGIAGGLAASLLKSLSHNIADFLQNDFQWKYKYFLYLFFPLAGILLSVTYVKRFIRKSKFETGLTQILFSISRKSSRIDVHNIYSQIITSALTVGFGGSTGLEAPIVTSGSAIGSNVGRLFGLQYREVTLLLACGAASGIAGAFNSPVAGIVFAIEVLLPEFSIPAFIPLLISAATASVVARLFYKEQLFFLVTEGWEFAAIPFYVLMALLIGLFAIYVTRLSFFIKDRFKKIKNDYTRAIVGGLLLGGLIFIFPSLYGEGYITIEQLLAGQHSVLASNSLFSEYDTLPVFIIFFGLFTIFAKSFATLITLAAGGNGGVFGPSLIMGGLGGFVFAHSINQTGMITLNTSNFIVAGMAAALSSIMHAPLTGIFLIAEITGGYELMTPLMIVSAIAYFVSRKNLKYSMYTKVLAEKGELLSHEDKDSTILQMMKLKYLIDKDFVPLKPEESPLARRNEIIHSKRNVFPVLDEDGKLLGLAYSEQLFDELLDKKGERRIKDLMQAPPNILLLSDSMKVVMKKMEKDEVWILPVVNAENKYLGFVSKTRIFNKYRSLLLRQAGYLH
ncbi:chloride channel protein [Pedobacter sp. SYSU D00535]|uniref:chloride channel protein n=1 Tax=Pedobacter sp. SYSU D00535 TaxID=2810308 RepID=UPI001A97AE5E|nr:chloride channel protein [Pedobacter sp. SYSU D00535]